MAKMLHRAAQASENHVIQRWEVADAGSRATIVPTPADVGGVARQADDGSLWALTSLSPVTWWRVAPDLDTASIIATGSSTGRSLAARFADEVNVRDFGALANGSNDAAAFQAAINYAVSSGKRALYIPPGTYTISTSLNCTAIKGFSIHGAGPGWYNLTKIYASTPGRALFDLVGSSNFTIRGLHIWGDQTNPPAAAFLFSRDNSMGGAGVHLLEDVQANGWFSIADVVSISSEVNRYHGVSFQNTQANAHAFWSSANNDAGIVSSYRPVPATQSGGNTHFEFIGSQFNVFGGGTAAALKGQFTNASWTGCYTNSNGLAAFDLVGGITNSVISGHRDESSSTYGIKLAAATSRLVVVGGKFSRGIWGDDGVAVSRLTLLSTELAWAMTPDPPGPWTLNVDTLLYSVTDQSNNVKVRTKARAVTFLAAGEGQQAGASLVLPTDSRGVNYHREVTRTGYAAGSGNPILEWHVGDGDAFSHVVTSRLTSSKFVDVVQAYTASALTPTPGLLDPVDTSKGSMVSVLLDQNLTVRNPSYGANNNTSDDGARLTFVFTQDATGGRTVTWPIASLQPPAAFKVDPTANATTSITFVADTKTNNWRAASWTVMRAAARADAPVYSGVPAALANAATQTDLNALGTILNDLLAKLRTAGQLAP